MSQKVWKRNFADGHGLEQVLAVTKNAIGGAEVKIQHPPKDVSFLCLFKLANS